MSKRTLQRSQVPAPKLALLLATLTLSTATGSEVTYGVVQRELVSVLTASSWTDLKTKVGTAASGSTIRLDPGFVSNYDSKIEIRGKEITIEGGGAVLDAARKGKFFDLSSSGTLTLKKLTLKNGYGVNV